MRGWHVTPYPDANHAVLEVLRKVTDGARTVTGIKKMEGKRLMLRRPKMQEAGA